MESSVNPAFHDIVSALVDSLVAQRAEVQRPELAPPYNDVTNFVLREHSRMAGGLREAMMAATFGFDLQGLLRGSCFSRLSPENRARQIESWRNSPISVQRDLIRFYESLTILGLHSRKFFRYNATPPTETAHAGVVTAPPEELRCEIAVVGSGPGGSITAALLAEAGKDVILIEEGPFLPLESCTPFSVEEMEQKYRSGGLTVAVGKTKIAYVEGRCVGGGSEINSGLYHRTPPDILEKWQREFQVEALSTADLLPHFEACERDVSVSRLPGPAPAASLKLHEGAERLGWKSMEVPRWFRYDATAPGEQPRGTRQSMTRTFVPRFLAAGGRLLPNTRVQSLRGEGHTWKLSVSHPAGVARQITADTVFCCAGAVQTPALLRRSGIGRHMGNSFRLHPTVKLVGRFPETINSASMGVPVHQVKEFSPRLSFGCSISSPPYLAMGLLDHPTAAKNVLNDWTHRATYYAMITGEGFGTVRPIPGMRDPLVQYRLTPADLSDLGDGLYKLAESMFAAGATDVFPALPDRLVLRGPDDLKKLPESFPAGASGLMTIHLFSSCPMGEDQTKCAADSFGRVHGAPGLFIADASLLCGAPGVNPQGTIMALARRNVLHFLGKT